MLQNLAKKHASKLRFGLVGIGNTALDFGLLFFFVWCGIPKLFANFLSTGIAFGSSFHFNRKFTFRSNGDFKKQIVPFLLVTFFGLWVIQPIIITLLGSLPLLAAKLIATVASMTWNYLLYSRFVFKEK